MAQQPRFGEPSTLPSSSANKTTTPSDTPMARFITAANYNAYNTNPKTSDLMWSETCNGQRYRMPLPSESHVLKPLASAGAHSFSFGVAHPLSEPSQQVTVTQPGTRKRNLSVDCTHAQLTKRLRGEQHPKQAGASHSKCLHCGELGHDWASCEAERCPTCLDSHPRRRCPAMPLARYTPQGFAIDATSSVAKPSTAASPAPSTPPRSRPTGVPAELSIAKMTTSTNGIMNPARAALMNTRSPSPPAQTTQRWVEGGGPERTAANMAPLGERRPNNAVSGNNHAQAKPAPTMARLTGPEAQRLLKGALAKTGIAVRPPSTSKVVAKNIASQPDYDRLLVSKRDKLKNKIIDGVLELGLRGNMALPPEQERERLQAALAAAQSMVPWLSYLG